jgi:hypothetical protein
MTNWGVILAVDLISHWLQLKCYKIIYLCLFFIIRDELKCHQGKIKCFLTLTWVKLCDIGKVVVRVNTIFLESMEISSGSILQKKRMEWVKPGYAYRIIICRKFLILGSEIILGSLFNYLKTPRKNGATYCYFIIHSRMSSS